MAGFGSIANSLAKNVLSGAKNIATNFVDNVGSTYIPDYKPINPSYNSYNAPAQAEAPKQPTISDLLNQTASSVYNNLDFSEPKQPNFQDIAKEGFKNITDIFGDSLTDNIAKNINSSSEKEKTNLSDVWNNIDIPRTVGSSLLGPVIGPLAFPQIANAKDYSGKEPSFLSDDINSNQVSKPISNVDDIFKNFDSDMKNITKGLGNSFANTFSNNVNNSMIKRNLYPIASAMSNDLSFGLPISQEYSPLLEIGNRSNNYSNPLDAINKAGKLQQDFLIDQIYNNDYYDAYDAAHNLAPGGKYTSFKDIPIESLQEENRRNNVAREQAEWQKNNPNNGALWRLDDLNKASQLNLEAINADPDDAVRDNEDWANKANEAAKLFSNDYVYTDMPIFTHRYVQDQDGAVRRGANSETWMPLIDTEAAPKEYNQMDRFDYFIDNTPYGQEWINKVVPDAYQDGGENIFSKFRTTVLDNIDKYNQGEMNIGDMGDATSLMWADIFSDATGIPLERGADGKLTDESRALVNAWTQQPENIFFLEDMLMDPLNYINDPTFLNYGFDANAILDLTDFLINHGMNPYDVFQAEDIVNKQLLKNSGGKFNGSISGLRNLNNDDVADYMLSALIAQEAKLKENLADGEAINPYNKSSIGLRDAQFIRSLAGQPNLTSDINLADTTNKYNKPLDLHPYAEETPFLPYVYDKNGAEVENPTLSSQFTDTILKAHPEWYVEDKEKVAAQNQSQNKLGFTTNDYSPDVQLMNPMWW